jgi:hypothetical protein
MVSSKAAWIELGSVTSNITPCSRGGGGDGGGHVSVAAAAAATAAAVTS